ncbi:hypothetical protein AQUCO_06800092v1 [Aquilegia coerulea]|uniref:Uncharacterized protein n=1 Tax=Aquilegia coerulea TaxID=218851 RepID=A0A2G5CBL6_AQUCA|nr:hypothetical protein AQUCO_06800092v1 [Aquilegia coerulea]
MDITDDKLVNSIKETLNSTPPFSSEPCIYSVPDTLRWVNEEAYTPNIISIGPLHYGKERLRKMEVNKQRYLNDFLIHNPNLSLKDYVVIVRDMEDRTRNSYAEHISFTSNELVKIMLLDSCFLIEYFIKYKYRNLRNKDDPLFQIDILRSDVKRDTVLIENQLPFFILEHLFNAMNVAGQFGAGNHSFLLLVLNFYGKCCQDVVLHFSTHQVRHFVDLLLYFYIPADARMEPKGNDENRIYIPNATALHDAGVKFRNNTNSQVKCILDVKFSNGMLEMPMIEVCDTTESELRNMIAFEQCISGDTRYLSDYVTLMDCLIDTPNDAALLRKYEIINNMLGNNEAVKQVFNKLGKCIALRKESFYFSRLLEDVNAYYNTRWHVWKATLTRNYFNSPWSITSVIAAVILLILAFIQTVCSIGSLNR